MLSHYSERPPPATVLRLLLVLVRRELAPRKWLLILLGILLSGAARLLARCTRLLARRALIALVQLTCGRAYLRSTHG